MASSRTNYPDHHRPQLFVISLSSFLILSSLCYCISVSDSKSDKLITIDSLRASLEEQEDFIVFSLIERARYLYNYPAYEPSYLGLKNYSLAEAFVRETEAIEAKFGRYQNPEELPFFPAYKAFQTIPYFKFSQVLHPPASSINVSRSIWDMYFTNLLPLIAREGDDGNYQQAAASDLICLKALSKRIHYGRFVAEVKFRDAPTNYLSAIHAKDSETLTRLVTSKAVEETVIERVKKKAEVFGQNVTVEENAGEASEDGNYGSKYKVDPSVVSNLYAQWVIPLTKLVEVNYLLHRLD